MRSGKVPGPVHARIWPPCPEHGSQWRTKPAAAQRRRPAPSRPASRRRHARQRSSGAASWAGRGGGNGASEEHGMLALPGSRCGTPGRSTRCPASPWQCLSRRRLPRLRPAWQPVSAKEVQQASPGHCDGIARPPPAGAGLNRACHRDDEGRSGKEFPEPHLFSSSLAGFRTEQAELSRISIATRAEPSVAGGPGPPARPGLGPKQRTLSTATPAKT
jgi:hypothetical protein